MATGGIVLYREHNIVFRNVEELHMPKNEPHLDLTVKSTSGQLDDRWNRSNRAQKVLDDAIDHFKLASTTSYFLKLPRTGAELALGEKLEDLGVVDGDTILVQARQAKDG